MSLFIRSDGREPPTIIFGCSRYPTGSACREEDVVVVLCRVVLIVSTAATSSHSSERPFLGISFPAGHQEHIGARVDAAAVKLDAVFRVGVVDPATQYVEYVHVWI